MTLERELVILDQLAIFGRWTPAYLGDLKQRLRDKYAAGRNGDPDAPEGA